ncbi:MAG: M57 family metalloprotease [Cytophagales bacterium]|nr:M57 family metalloprotease [Cytophagales bacterium]
MKQTLSFLCLLMLASGVFYSCQDSQDVDPSSLNAAERNKLISLGFDVVNHVPIRFDGGYLVEGDIYLTPTDLATMGPAKRVAAVEQYSTNQLVTGLPRTVTVYIPTSSFSAAYVSALDVAISRYNAENLVLNFQRVTTSNATIVFTRLRKGEERQGILGSAGFPTSAGNPYGQIKMSGILESTYGLSVNGIATIMAHEMGHCVGMRHTDYYDRSVSCGGAASNEGASTVGANLIPGTPATATLAAKSWMLACTDGSDRPFNNDDKTALNYLY